jgi:hypothetical protein
MKHMKKLIKPTAIFLAFTMLLSMATPFLAPAAGEAAKLQPYLAEMAAASPGEMVRVIVQKADMTDRAEKFAEKLGAIIYAKLDIINGFAAMLPAELTLSLAEHASVQWVSYDAPMTFSTLPKQIYYSVGTSTADLKSGTPKMNISSGTATFTVDQPGNIGVGDKITYNSTNIAFISGRVDSKTFTVITKTGALPANVSNATVNSIKRTFNALSTALDSASGSSYLGTSNLVSGNYQLNFPCYNDGDMNDYADVIGYSTDEDNFLRIYTPYLESEVGTSQRHTGHPRSGFRLVPGDNHDALKVMQGYVHVDGLEISIEEENWEAGIWVTEDASGEVFASHNLIYSEFSNFHNYGVIAAVLNNSVTVYLSNNFIFEIEKAVHFNGSAATGYFYSNSIFSIDTGIEDIGATTTAISNVVLNCGNFCFGGPWGGVNEQSHNISSDDTAEGTGSMTGKSASSIFTSTTFGSEDLHLKEGSDAIGAGADLDEDPYLAITDDIDGGARDSSSPDIGADEFGVVSGPPPGPPPQQLPTTNTYIETLGVDHVRYNKGTGVTVAVIDSGIQYDADFGPGCSYWWCKDRIVAHISGVPGEEAWYLSPNNDDCSPYNMQTCWYVTDQYGHGTHVAGIIAGNGADSGGLFAGIAPQAKLVSFRVSDANGMAHESGIVEAMQNILELRDMGIYTKVVNISINSTIEQSYNESPLDAAVEILWLNGIVVVASAGNSGGLSYNTIDAAPANDPYIITVGATDEAATPDRGDDIIPTWSSYGVTMAGFAKPEIYAPGRHIISVLSSKSPWATSHPNKVVDGGYFRMGGTSMSAPMVAGAAAMLLYAKPGLTPDQVKYALINTGSNISSNGQSGKYLNVQAALNYVNSNYSIPAMNQGNMPHLLLRKSALIAYWANYECDQPVEYCDLSSVNWSSVNWSSVNWSSVNWSSVNWSSVNWSSVNWSSVNWSSVNWSSVNWSSVNWSSVNWSSVNWSSVNWSSICWNSTFWED